jgi:hypothetical protein
MRQRVIFYVACDASAFFDGEQLLEECSLFRLPQLHVCVVLFVSIQTNGWQLVQKAQNQNRTQKNLSN